MIVEQTNITGLYTITPVVFTDERGYFFRSFCKEEMTKAGLPDLNFIQMNESYNEKAGTFRGFHFQFPPFSEDKLVRCTAGAVIDFAIDIRKGSPTFMKIFSVELSAENHKMIFISKGFAHGFITLKPHTVLLYHHTVKYQPGQEGGINFKDPAIHFNPPTPIEIISEKDKNYSYLSPDFKGLDL